MSESGNAGKSYADLVSAGYEESEGAFRVEFDPATESPCLAVVAALDAVDATGAASREPLGTVVDTDALEALFASLQRDDPASPSGGRVTFRYADYEVTVHTTGVVEIPV